MDEEICEVWEQIRTKRRLTWEERKKLEFDDTNPRVWELVEEDHALLGEALDHLRSSGCTKVHK